MGQRITVIGDGGMGTVCAIMLAENGHEVCLWSAFAEQARAMQEHRENRKFLPGKTLPDAVSPTADDALALGAPDWVLSAVPTQYLRGVWGRLAERVEADLAICSVTKGVENRTLARPTEVLAEVLGGKLGSAAVLSGPSIAPEIARELPATVTVASTDTAFADRVQEALARPYFRVYTNPDLAGVELAGATKNVIAIAAGILDGLEMGDNAKAALLARGLAEIARLGEALGAHAETFYGLSGVGDLVTTCISPVGRNRSFGEAMGRGMSAEEAQARTEAVVEGVATCESVVALADREGVDMPITRAVHGVIAGKLSGAEAVRELMTRPLKSEA